MAARLPRSPGLLEGHAAVAASAHFHEEAPRKPSTFYMSSPPASPASQDAPGNFGVGLRRGLGLMINRGALCGSHRTSKYRKPVSRRYA
jgi:hypothetical protein